jgi:hypothetical protein
MPVVSIEIKGNPFDEVVTIKVFLPFKETEREIMYETEFSVNLSDTFANLLPFLIRERFSVLPRPKRHQSSPSVIELFPDPDIPSNKIFSDWSNLISVSWWERKFLILISFSMIIYSDFFSDS